jgi:alkyl hydroperoxide reductase subunit AhpF
MLDTNMKTQLKAYLEKLTKPVELIATLDDSAKSAEIKELLAEIAELSDKVTFKQDDTLAVRKPSFLITNPGSHQGPRFAGSPLGHEFTSLVWRCCGPVVIRRKKRSLCLSRSAILTVILSLKPITHSPAITARMWCRR